jgi:hypothetical protein
MADKYIKIGTNGLQEVEATTTSSGSADAGKIVALYTDGKLHTSVLPDGVGAEVFTAPAYENLSAGDLVNVFSDSGVMKVRKADATGGISKRADGYVKEAVSSGNTATVYFSGVIPRTGLTIGARYFLSNTPGSVTTIIPTTSGHLVQYIGKAISTTELLFEPDDGIVRA